MKFTIRGIKADEYCVLDDFLYYAIFIPDGVEKPPKSIINLPELRVYVDKFGKSADDRAFVAETEGGEIVGAVWTRIMNDYGHVDDETPSLAISVKKEFRNKKIGTSLMTAILRRLKADGYKKVSLSVQKKNYALKMYEKLGFKTYADKDDELIMICVL